MQKSIAISDLRKSISDITDEIERKGTIFVLVRNGKPVAKLVPTDSHTDLSPEFANLVDTVFADYQADLKKLAETP
jgi:antitoxin (DNA-binding transcriptional repressor) of toxin-antitoxin stability system